jgi:hypothetical protein
MEHSIFYPLCWSPVSSALHGTAPQQRRTSRIAIGSPGGLPSRLPHHLTCGSASGGSGQINGRRIILRVLLAVMHLDPLFL